MLQLMYKHIELPLRSSSGGRMETHSRKTEISGRLDCMVDCSMVTMGELHSIGMSILNTPVAFC